MLTVLGRLPQRTGISRGDLSEADLSGAQLLLANLSGALLIGATLSDALLPGADLSGAQLPGANLSGADLIGATLSGVDLHGADLSEALGLRQPQLDAARGDWSTQLPEGLQRPDSWPYGEASAPVSS